MGSRVKAAIIMAAFVIAAAPAAAQAPAASLARTPDGKPDLSGIWKVMNNANWNIRGHEAQEGVPAEPGVVEGNDIPYQPWAVAKREENFKNRTTGDPEKKCYLLGVPRITYMPLPFQIFQMPNMVVMAYEYANTVRYIYTDGSQHPEGPIEWWMGDSRGRWEGDTLVVDNVHFTDQTWFDRAGNFHSEQLHVVERFTPLTANHIDYAVTIEDPKVFTRPWNMRMVLYRAMEPNARLMEYVCYGWDVEQYYPYPGAMLKK